MSVPVFTQPDLDFVVPVTHEILTVEEVAAILRYDRTTIYDMVLTGALEIHRRPAAEKSHLRVTRRSVVAVLISTATYEPRTILEKLAGIARTLTADRRRELGTALLATGPVKLPIRPTQAADFDFLIRVKKDVLTIHEVAAILRYDSTNVRLMQKANELAGHRRDGTGTHHRILRASVLEWLRKTASYEPGHIARVLLEITPAESRRALAALLFNS